MNKSGFSIATAAALVLIGGCGGNNEAAEEADSGEDVLERALTLMEERDNYFEQSRIESTDMREGEEEMEIREVSRWVFPRDDGHILERIERTENDGAKAYDVSVEEGERMVSFTEGDDTAVVTNRDYGGGISQQDMLENMYEGGEFELEGTEEVNGREAYHITSTEETDGMTDYWFDKETYYLLKKDGSDGSLPHVTEEVVEFDLDPDFDEEMFELEEVVPEEMDIVRN
ncbi:hypothetical protein [Alkalicoccus halolimnae]|uniref:Outer membrane lipoprotein carrier protein LolA n=1 Tax=Alkalicoccus halolimnae TaxID=1667239 RepID=A0A5C7F5Q0_9BACI|nr:hypothetical protein [Alkalicoccus halolimnae]TXF85383.1 hypothetical protein FTX54_09385 [Alkalicoccus halolimnae]